MSASELAPELSAAGFDESAIAVVGMACRLPGAPDIAAFWDLLAQGRDVISRFSAAELTAAGLTPEQFRAEGYVPAKGVLQDADCFDAGFFGLAPSDAAVMDPQQRVFIECAHSALEHAGYGTPQAAQVGVFGGSILSMYMLSHLWPNKQLLDSAGVFSVAVGNDPTFLATRASYLLNLTGPSMSLGTACSTGLVAVHQACQSLLALECDMALAGGVSIHLPLVSGYSYAPGSILSPDGACRPFDAAAAGTVSSDGCGVVTLKRLEDAQTDGDTIHAVIRGSAVNNDGHEKIGYTAPSVTPQARVIAEAQEISGTPPETIAMIEAHAAGTSVGDPVEVAALKEVFAESTQPCAIGSVKSNIGHVDAASGIAGLIKTVLALQHRAIPPSVHFATPNPALELEQSCFYVPQQMTAYDPSRGPMRAGVSSFGIGGTNCHVILQEPPVYAQTSASDPARSGRPCHLLQLSACTAEALEQMAQELATALEQPNAPPLADVANTLRCGRQARDLRRALVADNSADAVAQLRKPFAGQAAIPQRLAFMFPGLGDHYPAMGWELYCLEPCYRNTVDTCAAELAQHRRGDIRDQLFAGKDWRYASSESIGPDTATGKLDMRAMLGRSRTQQPDPLEDPVNGQAAIFVTEYALAQLLQSWGLQPAALTGYSIGEFVAACIAGIVTLKDALRIVATRAALIRDQAGKGGMMAVPLGEAELQGLLPVDQVNSQSTNSQSCDRISLAAANGPRMSIVSGPDAALTKLAEQLQAQGHSCQRLGSTFAYHSTMMHDIVPALHKVISTVPLSAPSIPCVSCVTGDWLSVQEATDPGYWAAHLSQTVRFRDAVATLLTQDGLTLVEVGPGQSLCAHARSASTAIGSKIPLVPMMKWSYSQQPEYRTLLQAIGVLWAGGTDIDPARLMADPSGRRVPLPTYPFARQRHWVDAQQTAAIAADGLRKPVADWALAPSWKPAPLPRITPLARAHYVVLMDGSEACSALLQALRDAGAKATAFWPDAVCAALHDVDGPFVAECDAFAALIGSLPADPDLPVHFLHLDLLNDFADFETTQAHGYHAIVALLQAIALSRLDAARLTVVGAGLSDPGQDGRLKRNKVPVLGVLKVAGQERPGLITQALDLDRQLPGQIARDILANLAEPQDAAQDATQRAPLAAYRRGRRLVETQVPLALPATTDTGVGVIRANGTYVITGGLGGVGLALAKALTSAAPVRLALLGRSPLDETLTTQQLKELDVNDPNRRRIEALHTLRKAGAQVLTLAADVADLTAMEDAFAQIEAHFGPIHGVFHCAGAIDATTFCEIASETRQSADRQFHAKVHGTEVLARMLKNREADFCVLTSSLAAQLGGLGFSAYAAANLYLDAFAEAQSGAGGTRWLSINWDAWQLGEVKSAVKGFGSTVSSYFMEPEAACSLLLRALAQDELPRVIVSTGDLEQRMAQWLHRPAHPAVLRQNRTDAPRDLALPQTPTQAILVEIWQDLFAIEPIGIHEDFFSLGGHSLLATQLNARISSRLSVDLPLAAVLNSPSIAELAEKVDLAALDMADPQILDGLLSELDGLSEAELGALLEQEGSA